MMVFAMNPRDMSVWRRRAHALAAGLLLATLLMIGRGVAQQVAVRDGRDPETADARLLTLQLRSLHPQVGSIFIISPTHSISFPLILDLRMRWASRYISMWPIRAIDDSRGVAEAKRHQFQESFVRDVVDDLTQIPRKSSRWTRSLRERRSHTASRACPTLLATRASQSC